MPMMCENSAIHWWVSGGIGGLRETAEPLRVPWIEPVMGIVRREEHVRVRVVGTCRQLHQQQRPMHRQGNQQNGGKGIAREGKVGDCDIKGLPPAIKVQSCSIRDIRFTVAGAPARKLRDPDWPKAANPGSSKCASRYHCASGVAVVPSCRTANEQQFASDEKEFSLQAEFLHSRHVSESPT